MLLLDELLHKMTLVLAKSSYIHQEDTQRDSLPGLSDCPPKSEPQYVEEAKRLMDLCAQLHVDIVSIDDSQYPENLRTIPDPPSILFVKGSTMPTDRLSVGLVGTRRASGAGKQIASEIAEDLARAGITIVSGLAYGIDAAAHRGALSVGGRTIACLGQGPDVVYPKSNFDLYGTIPSNGALISEYPPGTEAKPWHFPRRNRLIAGLSLGLVVIEAGEKSGALITADWALRQGKPVMAVPGSVKSIVCRGTNRLIQDGAYLVTCAEDVLSFLRKENEYMPEVCGTRRVEALTLEESVVLEAVGRGESLDQICSGMNMPVSKIIAILSSLEVRGIVHSVAGGKYILSNIGDAHIN